MLQLSKTVCSFSMRLLVEKLLALKVDSEKFWRDRYRYFSTKVEPLGPFEAEKNSSYLFDHNRGPGSS